MAPFSFIYINKYYYISTLHISRKIMQPDIPPSRIDIFFAASCPTKKIQQEPPDLIFFLLLCKKISTLLHCKNHSKTFTSAVGIFIKRKQQKSCPFCPYSDMPKAEQKPEESPAAARRFARDRPSGFPLRPAARNSAPSCHRRSTDRSMSVANHLARLFDRGSFLPLDRFKKPSYPENR